MIPVPCCSSSSSSSSNNSNSKMWRCFLLLCLFSSLSKTYPLLLHQRIVRRDYHTLSVITSERPETEALITSPFIALRNAGDDVGTWSAQVTSDLAKLIYEDPNNSTKINLPVQAALQKMRKDMDFLDDVASRSPQLTTVEVVLLFTTVVVSAISPIMLSLKVVEVLVPSMAALSASIAISAEYVGKVAVANGKEFAALAIQAAAEAEILLAAAERTKAVLPLCVGIATTASFFALLAPSLAAELSSKTGIPLINEVYLLCPLISVLAAAIAGLATQEAQGLANRAIGVGNRRFASSSSVGNTWLSATEQVETGAERLTKKWKSFAIGVLPAPIVASLFPGSFAVKTIVCAAIAAAQSSYYLAIAEYSIAASVDAVALKSRASAVSDTYANQATRAGAILPFTSALAGLCAAASAAVVELLPLVPIVELQSVMSLLFPTGAALLASAAAVSKARCEVDSKAAGAAAAMGLSGENNDGKVNKDPVDAVRELLKSTVSSSTDRLKMKWKKFTNTLKKRSKKPWENLIQWLRIVWSKIGRSTPPPTSSSTTSMTSTITASSTSADMTSTKSIP